MEHAFTAENVKVRQKLGSLIITQNAKGDIVEIENAEHSEKWQLQHDKTITHCFLFANGGWTTGDKSQYEELKEAMKKGQIK